MLKKFSLDRIKILYTINNIHSGKKMKIRSVVDYAKDFIERCIVTGELAPGQRIKEEEVSARLEISRPPIREAFKILETEGLIKKHPRRGVFVTQITEKDLWEIYTLKMALYGLASRLATVEITEKEIKKLEKIIIGMKECVEKDPPDIIKYQSLNDSFHLATINLIRHERLKKIILSLNNQIHRYSFRSLNDKKHLLSSYGYHRKIFDAIRKRDKDLAENLTREHVLKGLEFLQVNIKRSLEKS